ncbi:MAG: AMP-dependent synthetase and ligase, partial [Verrucomicrobiales bacterium]|nr:AMP-dependent synthetase and ligase [Verrucomicrobiales bacterium]
MLVHDFLAHSAQRIPDKTAVICDGQRLSYGDLDRRSNQLANALKERGIKRGDRVGLFLPNSIAMAVGIFGTLKAGAVFVPINHTTKREKLVHILQNCRTSALITDTRGAAQGCVSKIAGEVPWLRCVVVDHDKSAAVILPEGAGFLQLETIQKEFPGTRLENVNIDLDLACLIYTSGSTGEPKGVMCDHSNVGFLANSITTYLENTERDVVMNVLPLSFSYGLYQLLMMVKCGGTLVLENTFAFPALILKRMEQERVTGFPGVPTIFT